MYKLLNINKQVLVCFLYDIHLNQYYKDSKDPKSFLNRQPDINIMH